METVSRLTLTFLLNCVWQVAGVAAVTALCGWMLRKAPARHLHRLWVAGLLLSVLLPLWSLRSASEKTAVNAAVSEASAPGATLGADRPVPVTVPRGSSVAAGYLMFLLYRLARLGRAWRRTQEIRRTACVQPIPELLRSVAARCRQALGLESVPILCSAQVNGPLTVGAWRPVVILPERLFAETSAEVLTSALGHELAHIRRRDFFFTVVSELFYLPVSICPAAMLLKKRIEQTRELACDELVTERLVDAQSYARSLTGLAGSMLTLARPGYTLGVFDAGILEERVRRLLERRGRGNTPRLLLAAACLVMTVASLAGLAFSLAPAGSSSILGTVFDPSRAVVPGAAVSLLNLDSGFSRAVLSSAAGDYSFHRLPAGRYRLEVRVRGFQVLRLESLRAEPDRALRANVVLQLGRVHEMIVVHD